MKLFVEMSIENILSCNTFLIETMDLQSYIIENKNGQ